MRQRSVLGVGVALACAALAPRAGAEPPAAIDQDPLAAPEIDASPTWKYRLAEKMTLAGDTMSLSLRAMTFDSMDLKFDGHSRVAHLKVHAGKTDNFRFKLDSDIAFKKGYARVDAKLELAVMGKNFKVDLPDFDMVPRSYDGQRYVELRLPVIDFKF